MCDTNGGNGKNIDLLNVKGSGDMSVGRRIIIKWTLF